MRTGAVGLSLSTDGDSRITRVGRWVRASKLDELPQLIDVLRGDMSLVGPRPEVPEYVASWPDLERELILSVHPGITDPASVILRHESAMLAAVDDPDRYYREVLLPLKTTVYVNYVTRRSFAGDFAVLVATLRALITPAPAVTKDLARRFGADFEDGGLGKCCTI